MKTASPNKLIARFACVLSDDCGLVKVPIRIVMIVARAPRGRRNLSGMRLMTLTTELSHAHEMACVTGLMDTWSVTRRIVMQSHRRKGISQPRSSRWRTKPAIHHLMITVSFIQAKGSQYAYPVNNNHRKIWKKILYLAKKSERFWFVVRSSVEPSKPEFCAFCELGPTS